LAIAKAIPQKSSWAGMVKELFSNTNKGITHLYNAVITVKVSSNSFPKGGTTVSNDALTVYNPYACT
jgi:hypothetical protein